MLARKQLLLEIQRRPVTFVPGKKVVSILPGDWTSPFEGKGYEPLGYRDFELGDDPRRINLPASTSRGQPTIISRAALREFKIMVVIDDSNSMRMREKWDIQIKLASLLLYSAFQAETSFGLGIKTRTRIRSLGLGIGSRHFYHLYRKLWNLLSGKISDTAKGREVHLSRCLPPNAMLLYCSDFLGGDGEIVAVRRLSRAARHFDFVPIIIQDELEYSFPQISASTLVPFINPETGLGKEAWISPAIAQSIRAVHEARFNELTELLSRHGVRPLHLNSANLETMSAHLDLYFRRRKGTHAA